MYQKTQYHAILIQSMKKSPYVYVAGATILSSILVVWYLRPPQNQNPPAIEYTPMKSTVTIGTKTVIVELADTDEEITTGLGGRSSLEHDHGMLFIFNREAAMGFWMKNMHFPIDIIWIKTDTVIAIHQSIAVQPENAADADLPQYFPPEPVTHVLEVPAGWSSANSIKVGDRVVISDY